MRTIRWTAGSSAAFRQVAQPARRAAAGSDAARAARQALARRATMAVKAVTALRRAGEPSLAVRRTVVLRGVRSVGR